MAVVGKVGTFAQVQPVQGPDFGGMVKAEFDKLDAERKAKEAAKAKAETKKQEELDKLTLPSVKTTNNRLFNKQVKEKADKMYNKFIDLKREGRLDEARQIERGISSLNNAVDVFNSKSKQLDNEENKYNPNFANEFRSFVANIDDANIDIEYKEDDNLDFVTVYKGPEKKEVLVRGNLNEVIDSTNIPYNFTADMLNKSAEGFARTYKPDKIETMIDKGSLYGTQSVEDALNAPDIEDELRKQAKKMVANRDSRALYAADKGISLFQLDRFDEDQIKDAEDYFYKTYRTALRNEINLSISKKSGGGSKGPNVPQPGAPALYQAGTITLEEQDLGNKNITPTANQSYTRSFTDPKGNPLVVSSMPLDRILYDKKTGRMYVSLSRSKGVGESLGADGQSLSERASEKVPVWYGQGSDVFNRLVTGLNSTYGWDLKTVEDLKNKLFSPDAGI